MTRLRAKKATYFDGILYKKGQRIDLFLYEHASLTLISISILPVQHMTGGVCPRSVLMLLLSR